MKRISALLLLVIFGFGINVSAQDNIKLRRNKDYQSKGSDIPQLNLKTIQAKNLTNKDIKPKNHLFLIIVSLSCDQCINVTKSICDNSELFKDSKVIFMTRNVDKPHLKSFKKKTGIEQHPEFILGFDQSRAVIKLGTGILPQINIYNKDKKLVDIIYGGAPLKAFKPYLP